MPQDAPAESGASDAALQEKDAEIERLRDEMSIAVLEADITERWRPAPTPAPATTRFGRWQP